MKTAVALCFVFFALTLYANFVQNQPFEFTQPDGTVLTLLSTGDEYYHRVHDAKGYTILKDPKTGYAVYAVPDGKSYKASDYAVGRVDPATLGILPNLIKSREEIDSSPLLNYLPARNPGERVPPTGWFNNIVIFLRFSDQTEFPPERSFGWYNNQFNSTGQQSLKDYYHEVSNNQLNINSYLYCANNNSVASFQSVWPRGYYSPFSDSNLIGYTDVVSCGIRLAELVAGICAVADSYIPDDIDCDVDGDGTNDGLTFVIRGGPDHWSDLLWPTSYDLPVPTAMLNGVPIHHFIFVFENSTWPSTICHETGHDIGFPDMYRYDNDFIDPTGAWTLMSTDNAQHETAYEKMKYGHWFTEVPVITPSATPTQYTLTAIDQNPYACFKIASRQPGQYYMLEYRRKAGRYETGIPDDGLIVYRIIESFGGAGINGNADGPPDELYVYRPGGSVTEEGYVDSANLTIDEDRSCICDGACIEPWLYLDIFMQTWGDLSLAGIGPAGGTSISFTVLGGPSDIWTGDAGNGWDFPGSWSLNHVPDSNTWVDIPWSYNGPYPVVVFQSYCNHITVHKYASLSIGSDVILFNNGSLDVYGTLKMEYAGGEMLIAGDLNFHSNCTVTVSGTTVIDVQGNVVIEDSTAVDLSTCTLNMYGTGNSEIRLDASANVYDFHSHKNTGYSTTFTGAATESFNIKGWLRVYNGSIAYCNFGGAVNIYGNFYVYGGGTCHFDNGIVRMGGLTAGDSDLNFGDAGNYINQLDISKFYGHTVSLGSYITVKGDLNINSGYLTAGSQTIYAGGNWTNYAGSGAFTEGTSTVVFNGSGNQFCNWGESFYHIELNKPGGELRMTSPSAIVSCAALNVVRGNVWVGSGNFTANDISNNGIYGNWKLSTNGVINLHNYDGYVDLNGTLDISSGTFNVYGGTDDSYWSIDGNSGINMSGGTLDFHNTGIRVYSSSYTCPENVTGGTIRTIGNFIVERADFHPSGGWIELYGSADAQLRHAAGASIFNLKINKYVLRDEDGFILSRHPRQTESTTRTNVITALSNLVILGEFQLLGGTLVAPPQMNVSGNWTDTAVFTEGTGLVIFEGSGNTICSTETFNQLTLNKSGSGELQIPTGSVTCSTYDWNAGKLSVTGGTFTALDLADTAVLGTIYLNNGFIYYHQDASSYVDLRADVTILNGEFHVYGGTDLMLWPYAGNASLTMYGGVFDIHDRDVYINPGNTFTLNLTAGTIRVAHGFYSNRTDFNPGGGTLEMYSSNDTPLNMMAGSLYNLVVNKASRDEAERDFTAQPHPVADRPVVEETHARANTAFAVHSFTCHNLTVTAGIFSCNGYNLNCSGNINVNGGLFALGSTGTLTMSNARFINVNNGGTFYTYGTYDNRAVITSSTGYFNFNVEAGGTIQADFTNFSKTGPFGVNLKPGSLVDPSHSFYFCTFSNGVMGGTLLTLDCSQNLWIGVADFPANTWTGSSCVTKNVDAGVVNFDRSYGPFSGESFDNDIYERILWTSPSGPYDLMIAKAKWSKTEAALGDTVTLTVTVLNAGISPLTIQGLYLDFYENLATAPPQGYYGYYYQEISSLLGGVPVDFVFTITNDSPYYAGNWNSWLQIDTDDVVDETNESNNIYGPIPIEWVYLPPVHNLVITQAGPNTFRLNWPYYQVVDRFNIYRSSVAEFSPSPANRVGSVTFPTGNFFDTTTATRYFYIVTAERDLERETEQNVPITEIRPSGHRK